MTTAQTSSHPNLTGIDTVLFDMDGLLIDSETLSLQTFNETIVAYGLPDHSDLFMKVIGSNEASLISALEETFTGDIDAMEFRQDWDKRYHSFVKNEPVPLKPGSLELLDWLRAEGIKTAVATSSNTSLAQIKLHKSGLLQYFQLIIGGDQVSNGKPDPEIYHKAATAVSADAQRTLVLEDSSNGVRAGVAAGLHVIQVPDLLQPTPELLTLGHRVCADLHEVLVLLAGEADQGD